LYLHFDLSLFLKLNFLRHQNLHIQLVVHFHHYHHLHFLKNENQILHVVENQILDILVLLDVQVRQQHSYHLGHRNLNFHHDRYWNQHSDYFDYILVLLLLLREYHDIQPLSQGQVEEHKQQVILY